jgi:GntR family transcriptional regulator, vanillate catabolism transcriptional regulator
MATPAVEAADEPPSSSQTLKAQLRLRELIVGGALAPGERVPELALVERLGVSRTPVRAALHKLQDEGLLDALPGGGFAVKAFSEREIRDAIEVRGTLEGLAARLAAERGVARSLLAAVHGCLAAIDDLLESERLDEAAFGGYVDENARFHTLLSEMAGGEIVRRQVERAAALPFASPNAFVMVRNTGSHARDVLVVAQEQHRAVVEAIEGREGARAEALMREHARIALRNLDEVLASCQALQQLPGANLIRRGGR